MLHRIEAEGPTVGNCESVLRIDRRYGPHGRLLDERRQQRRCGVVELEVYEGFVLGDPRVIEVKRDVDHDGWFDYVEVVEGRKPPKTEGSRELATRGQ